MKKILQEAFNYPLFLVDLCGMCTVGALALLLSFKWYIWALLAVLTGVAAIIQFKKVIISNHSNVLVLKEVKATIHNAQKTGDSAIIYNTIEKKLLPEMRRNLSQRLFKYYPLSEDELSNECRLEALKNGQIWSSTCSQFNDPFEFKYMHMEAKDFEDAGYPAIAKTVWDEIMDALYRRMTTICFTQDPDSMPMWAHYANEHRGFCVEYQVIDAVNLYPVLYVDKRITAKELFMDLVYAFSNTDVPQSEKAVILKHSMLISAFKDKSWESENEVRAIFMNSLSELSPTGRLYAYNELGIRPCKIYIGTMCSEANKTKLISIAKDAKIEYKICYLSSGENFSII